MQILIPSTANSSGSGGHVPYPPGLPQNRECPYGIFLTYKKTLTFQTVTIILTVKRAEHTFPNNNNITNT